MSVTSLPPGINMQSHRLHSTALLIVFSKKNQKDNKMLYPTPATPGCWVIFCSSKTYMLLPTLSMPMAGPVNLTVMSTQKIQFYGLGFLLRRVGCFSLAPVQHRCCEQGLCFLSSFIPILFSPVCFRLSCLSKSASWVISLWQRSSVHGFVFVPVDVSVLHRHLGWCGVWPLFEWVHSRCCSGKVGGQFLR